jgi:hypothetical protein
VWLKSWRIVILSASVSSGRYFETLSSSESLPSSASSRTAAAVICFETDAIG